MKSGIDEVALFRVAMFTMKKNRAMNTGGITTAMSRGTARSARPAMEARSRKTPAGRARIDRVRRAPAPDGDRLAVVMIGSSSGVVPLDVGAGQLEEHVVERGCAEGQVAHDDVGGGQGDGHRADGGRAVPRWR